MKARILRTLLAILTIGVGFNSLAIDARAQAPPPRPGITPLSTPQIVATLKHLSSWPAFSQFKGYLILLPQSNLDLKSSIAANAANQTSFTWSPYNDPALQLSFRVTDHSVPPGVPPIWVSEYNSIAQAMFDPAHGGDKNNAICLVLDGFGTPVYLPVAERFEAAFIRGLVTRLVLGNYFRAWKLSDTALNFSTPGPPLADVSQIIAIPVPAPFTPPVFIPIGQPTQAPATITQTYFEPNQPPFVFTTKLAPMTAFDIFMGVEAYNHPVEPTAMMWGWRAGEQLDALRGTPDEAYRNDVVSLITARFSPYKVGEIVGYTLDYLRGFLANQRIQSFAVGTVAAPTPNMSAIAVSMNEPSNSAADKLMTEFERAVSLEVYGLSQSSHDANHVALGKVLAFQNGFEAGTVSAADTQFQAMTQVEYGAGFMDGWRFGYEQGYAAGYTVGYDQGWAKASQVLQQVESISSQNSGPDAASWISTVVEVGSAIASFF